MIKDINIIRAEIKKTYQKDLYKMMYGPDPRVRAEVAKRIDQPGLHKMMNDKSPIIRDILASRLKSIKFT